MNFSPVSLALSLLPSTNLSFFSLNFAHPLSNPSNYLELNPLFTGFYQGSHYGSPFFFSFSCFFR
jgi:hypothetical protein